MGNVYLGQIEKQGFVVNANLILKKNNLSSLGFTSVTQPYYLIYV